jgi:hypothetical protein
VFHFLSETRSFVVVVVLLVIDDIVIITSVDNNGVKFYSIICDQAP